MLDRLACLVHVLAQVQQDRGRRFVHQGRKALHICDELSGLNTPTTIAVHVPKDRVDCVVVKSQPDGEHSGAELTPVEVSAPIHVDLLEDLLALSLLPRRDLGVGAARLLRTAIRNGRREA